MVEKTLESYITRRLRPKASVRGDELMSRSAESPIGTFSAKINLAFRLGLFPENERDIYHQLRELRNVCAHNIDQQHFEAQRFKDRTKNIIGLSEPLWEALRSAFARNGGGDKSLETVEEFVEHLGWRRSFEGFFAMVVAHKEACIDRVPTLSALHAA